MKKFILRFLLVSLLVTLVFCPSQDASKKVPFDQIKHLISKYESADGVWKVNANDNRTIDCGYYQINSIHFLPASHFKKKSIDYVICSAFDKVFKKHGVGEALHERVAFSILDDDLNYDLAKTLYNIQGISAWTSHPKFAKAYEKIRHDKLTKQKSKSKNRSIRKINSRTHK